MFLELKTQMKMPCASDVSDNRHQSSALSYYRNHDAYSHLLQGYIWHYRNT